MRPKAGKYLVQYVDPSTVGDIREVAASSLREANELAEDKENKGFTGIRIISSDDIRMPKRRNKGSKTL